MINYSRQKQEADLGLVDVVVTPFADVVALVFVDSPGSQLVPELSQKNVSYNHSKGTVSPEIDSKYLWIVRAVSWLFLYSAKNSHLKQQ